MRSASIKIILFSAALFITAFTAAPFYKLSFPSYFPAPLYDLKKEPLSSDKTELGRALFYDPVLSKDNSISCASCHSPFNAFAHADHDLSHGIDDQIGIRNAPALMNLAWQRSFMWDGAINHLDMQALAPISHPKEMGEDLGNVVRKLGMDPLYRTMFLKAFNDTAVTGQRVLKALSQFQLTLVSANSKYDSVMRHESSFTLKEASGYKIFRKHCNSCHREPLFSTYDFANNGLKADEFLKDKGRMALTSDPADSLKFKIPSLRNLQYSAPYMHDGRFRKLSQVIDHYTNGIQQSPTLAAELKGSLKLTADERVELIAFLLTLNDKKFVFDPAFGYPGKYFSSERRK